MTCDRFRSSVLLCSAQFQMFRVGCSQTFLRKYLRMRIRTRRDLVSTSHSTGSVSHIIRMSQSPTHYKNNDNFSTKHHTTLLLRQSTENCVEFVSDLRGEFPPNIVLFFISFRTIIVVIIDCERCKNNF